MVTAYILIQTEVGKAAKVAAEIVDIPGVQQAQAVTGPYDVIVRAEARNLDELGQLVVARGAGGRRHHPDPHLSGRAPRVGPGAPRGHRPAASAGPTETVPASKDPGRGCFRPCAAGPETGRSALLGNGSALSSLKA